MATQTWKLITVIPVIKVLLRICRRYLSNTQCGITNSVLGGGEWNMSWSVQWQITELLVPLCTTFRNKFTITDLAPCGSCYSWDDQKARAPVCRNESIKFFRWGPWSPNKYPPHILGSHAAGVCMLLQQSPMAL